MSCESGVENLRTVLTNLTDIVDSKNLVDYEYVDVGFPIPFLKVITCQNKILWHKYLVIRAPYFIKIYKCIMLLYSCNLLINTVLLN